MHDISITIVAYHNYKDIKRAIESIEKYTSGNIKKHIYIVDNGASSDDETRQLALFVNSLHDAEYLDAGANLGFAKGHNYVIDRLDSKYHAIVNPDILLKEDSMKKLITFMDADEAIGMCVPKLIDRNGEMQLAYREYPTVFDMFIRMFCKNMFPKRIAKHTLQSKDYTQAFQVPFAQGSFLIIRTELFKQLGGFDDKFFMYLEDADLCRRVNQMSKLIYCPDTEVIHNWEKGSHKNKKLFEEHVKSMKYYFKKWGVKWY